MGDADEGFTLIEILVTLVIIGISVSAVLAGLGVASRGSGDTGAAADASAVLTATAEQIEQAADYEECPASAAGAYATARQAVLEPSGGFSTAVPAAVVNLSVWDGKQFVQPGAGTCALELMAANTLGGKAKMQRITLSHGDDTLTFVKRGP